MPHQITPGQIVILNGTPRSGKSSIVTVIQNTFAGVWMNLGVDRFMEMTPADYLPGIGLRPGGERPDIAALVPALYRALYESIAAHSRLGLNVVVDVGHHNAHGMPGDILAGCARRLAGLPVLFVGIRCPLETIMARRRATGWDTGAADDAPTQAILLWQSEVHNPGIYDLELDTSRLSPEQCATAIRERLESSEPVSAFQRLGGM